MSAVIIAEKNKEKALVKALKTIASLFNCAVSESDEIFLKACKKNHPDILFVQKEEDKNSISINHIKNIKHFLSFYPYEASCKIVFIKDAEKMTEEAQNALLKILEDRTANTNFVLVTNDRKNLLQTIQSRCTISNTKISDSEIQIVKNLLNFENDELEELYNLNNIGFHEIDALFSTYKKDKKKLAIKMLNDTIFSLREASLKQKESLRKVELLTRMINMVEKNVNPRLAVDNYLVQNIKEDGD